MAIKVMPHSDDAEISVLGCIMLTDSVQHEIFAVLKADDFYADVHRTIFDEMYQIYNANKTLDYVTLVDVLERKELLESVGGISYVTKVATSMPSAANYKSYVEMVMRDSMLRQVINACQSIAEKAYNETEAEEVLQYAEKTIYDIAQRKSTSSLAHIKDVLPAVVERFDKIARDKSAFSGIKTGFYALDRLTNGLQNSDLILLAARPSVGKTAFAMNIVQHVASVEKKKVAVFSLEMGKEQLAQRSLCSLAKVSMEKAIKGEMNSGEWKAIWASKNLLQESDIFIDDSSLNTPMDILGKCRRLKREQGLDLVMIDYLQLMSTGNAKDGRQNEVSEMSRKLKVMARELNIPVLVLSQLSRAVDKRTDHRPILSDLRESGAIEQDADIVMFLHKPFMYNDTQVSEAEKSVAELIVAKHRNGALDTIKLKWVGENASFRNMDKDSDMAELEKSMPENFCAPSSGVVEIPPEAGYPNEPSSAMSLDDYQDAELDIENCNAPDEIVPITDPSLSDIF